MLTLKHSLATANANEQITAKLNKLKLTLTFGLLFIMIITPLLVRPLFNNNKKPDVGVAPTDNQQKGPHKDWLHVLHSDIKRRNIVRRFID